MPERIIFYPRDNQEKWSRSSVYRTQFSYFLAGAIYWVVRDRSFELEIKVMRGEVHVTFVVVELDHYDLVRSSFNFLDSKNSLVFPWSTFGWKVSWFAFRILNKGPRPVLTYRTFHCHRRRVAPI